VLRETCDSEEKFFSPCQVLSPDSINLKARQNNPPVFRQGHPAEGVGLVDEYGSWINFELAQNLSSLSVTPWRTLSIVFDFIFQTKFLHCFCKQMGILFYNCIICLRRHPFLLSLKKGCKKSSSK